MDIKNIIQKLRKRFSLYFETAAQYFFITLELFNKHGLANHAAAGAYGFLFSAAPALLIVVFILSEVLKSSPETAVALISQIGLLSEAFDMQGLTETFLSASEPGIAGFFSIIGLLWTARIFALSIQRGVGIIFPDTEKINPAKKVTASLVIEAVIILFTFIAVATSEAALILYKVMGIFPFNQEWFAGFKPVLSLLTPLVAAGVLLFWGYSFIPEKKPKPKAAVIGTSVCLFIFSTLFLMSHYVFNAERYDIVYGTLGNLLILLVNVYFFFMLFFLGAELTFIINYFDALLLSRFIQAGSEPEKKYLGKKWYMSTKTALNKYVRFYKKDEVIFNKDENSYEVYYVLSGEAAVYLDGNISVAQIGARKLFGEMSYILSERRSATIKANTDLEVLVIPPLLFQDILKFSHDADQKVITTLSQRLKRSNETANEKLNGKADV